MKIRTSLAKTKLKKITLCFLLGIASQSSFIFQIKAEEAAEEISNAAAGPHYGAVLDTRFEADSSWFYLYGSEGNERYSSEALYYYFPHGSQLDVVVKREGKLVVHHLNDKMQETGSKEVSLPLPVFGGLYQASDGNIYLAVGQFNSEESRTKEVVRIVKYDAAWNQTGSCSISAHQNNVFEGIVEPFRSSAPEMTDLNGVLYLHMGRTMYVHNDGKNHQSDITIAVNMSSMKQAPIDDRYGSSNFLQPYSSHSFRQMIDTDGSALYFANHGDAYPRSIQISVAKPNSPCNTQEYFQFDGRSGDNYTGTGLGDLVVTDTNIIVSGSSEPHRFALNGITGGGVQSQPKRRNLFVLVTDKNGQNGQIRWLTQNNPNTSEYTYGPARIVKISNDRIVLMASRTSGSETNDLHYFVLDGKGSVLVDYLFENLPFGDGQTPVCFNGNLYWAYGRDSQEIYLHSIPYTDQQSAISYHPGSLKEGWVKKKQNGKTIWNYQFRGGAIVKGRKDLPILIQSIDGKPYCFDQTGKMLTGWIKDDTGEWMYFRQDGSQFTSDSSKENGQWLKDSSGNWYVFDGPYMAKNVWAYWRSGNNTALYYFSSSGNMVKNKWVSDGYDWYYFGTDGSAQTGWIRQGSHHYYLYPDGAMAKNTWIDGYKLKEDGTWDKGAGYHPENNSVPDWIWLW